MNLKVRAKNPVFWFNILLAVVAPVLAYFGLTGADFTTWEFVFETIVKAVQNPYVVFGVVVSVWNALNDPTTAGVGDSKRAMGYDRPFKEDA